MAEQELPYTEKTQKFLDDFGKPRRCFLEPIEEIFECAILLDDAATAYVNKRLAETEHLIKKADMPKLYWWTETHWGQKYPWMNRLREIEKPEIIKTEGSPPPTVEKEVINRDGYFCRYCGVPVIDNKARKKLLKNFPAALRWGGNNDELHCGFQALHICLDHVVPKSRGGAHEADNLVVCCWPCNNAKGDHTLAALGLENPLKREMEQDRLKYCPPKYRETLKDWDGLMRVVKTKR